MDKIFNEIIESSVSEISRRTDEESLAGLSDCDGVNEEDIEDDFFTESGICVAYRAKASWRTEEFTQRYTDPWCEERFTSVADIEVEVLDIEAIDPDDESILSAEETRSLIKEINQKLN